MLSPAFVLRNLPIPLVGSVPNISPMPKRPSVLATGLSETTALEAKFLIASSGPEAPPPVNKFIIPPPLSASPPDIMLSKNDIPVPPPDKAPRPAPAAPPIRASRRDTSFPCIFLNAKLPRAPDIAGFPTIAPIKLPKKNSDLPVTGFMLF